MRVLHTVKPRGKNLKKVLLSVNVLTNITLTLCQINTIGVASGVFKSVLKCCDEQY